MIKNKIKIRLPLPLSVRSPCSRHCPCRRLHTVSTPLKPNSTFRCVHPACRSLHAKLVFLSQTSQKKSIFFRAFKMIFILFGFFRSSKACFWSQDYMEMNNVWLALVESLLDEFCLVGTGIHHEKWSLLLKINFFNQWFHHMLTQSAFLFSLDLITLSRPVLFPLASLRAKP